MSDQVSSQAQDASGKLHQDCGDCFNGTSSESSEVWKRIAGTLTGSEIQRLGIIKSSKPSEPLENTMFQATTYDLRLGEGHYLYGVDPAGTRKWRCIFVGDEDRLQELNKLGTERFERPDGDHTGTLSIPPFGSALVQLDEIVDTLTVADDNKILVVGRFDLKLSNVHQGLISQQATQVEPCYEGHLFCFLHNLSNKKIDIKYQDKVATIEFSYVSCAHNAESMKTEVKKLKRENELRRYNKAPYCNKKGIIDVRHFRVADRLPLECGLWSLLETMTDKVNSVEVVRKLADNTDILSKLSDNVEKIIDSRRNKMFDFARYILVPILIPLISVLGGLVYASMKYDDKIDKLSADKKNYTENISKIETRISSIEGMQKDSATKISIDEFRTKIEELQSKLGKLTSNHEAQQKPLNSIEGAPK